MFRVFNKLHLDLCHFFFFSHLVGVDVYTVQIVCRLLDLIEKFYLVVRYFCAK